MTDLNESLAIFMGAVKNPDGHWTEYWKFPMKIYSPERAGWQGSMAKSRWNPCENLNQASLVVKRLGEMGLQAEFVEHLAAIIMPHDYKADGPAMFFTPWAAYELVAATAAQRMQAAYKVIKGGEAL